MAEKIVHGIPEVIANLKRYQFIKIQAVKDRLKKQSFKVELAGKEMCPVRYGRAKASITVNWSGSPMNRATIINPCRAPENPSKPDDTIGQPTGPKDLLYAIGSNVDYVPHLEHGTSKMPARPFLYPAYFMYEGETVMALAKIMKEDIKLA